MTMPEEFASFRGGLTAPPGDAAAIDLTDGDVTLPCCSRGIYIGTGGDLAVEMASGALVVWRGLVGGVTHSMRVKRIIQSETSAQDILALW
jgi:hypothetical protein